MRDLGVRAVDDVFKMATPLLREAADLRVNMQVKKNLLKYFSFMKHDCQESYNRLLVTYFVSETTVKVVSTCLSLLIFCQKFITATL